MAAVMANNSQTYVEARRSMELNDLLKKAMGCLFCNRVAPIPMLEVSVSTVKGSSKSGRDNTEVEVNSSFN